MPRLARLAPAGVPLHVMQRGNNKQDCFFDDQDRGVYLGRLSDALEAHSVALHAYVLMNNHIHLLITPSTDDGTGNMMKSLSQRYVQYFNLRYGRSGGLWEGRFKSCIVQSDAYLLNCYRYIELNPVRAGIAKMPSKHHWSSFLHNAKGAENQSITPHPSYLALGPNLARCRTVYRAFVEQAANPEETTAITRAVERESFYGNESCRAQTEATYARHFGVKRRGRPPKRIK